MVTEQTEAGPLGLWPKPRRGFFAPCAHAAGAALDLLRHLVEHATAAGADGVAEAVGWQNIIRIWGIGRVSSPGQP